jgi:hypothetical protein
MELINYIKRYIAEERAKMQAGFPSRIDCQKKVTLSLLVYLIQERHNV